MTTRDAVKLVEHHGTKMSKDKFIDALKRTNAKDLPFVTDAASGYIILIVKIG